MHTKKKIWEISQQIKELTGSDRKSILNLVNKLCVILNSRNIDALKKFEMYNWNLDNNRPKKVINRDLIKNLSTLFENADYSVENSSIKDLKFFEGTKIILLLNNHGNILRIAPKKGTDTDKKWHKEFCILRLHFLKIDGKWVMLNLLNDNLCGG